LVICSYGQRHITDFSDRTVINSLKIKFLGLTGLILIIAVIGTTWYNLHTQRSILEKMAAEHARLVAETVRNSIMTDMANGRNEQVSHTLARVSREPAIDALRIFDETGRVIIADNPRDIGTLVPTADLLAFRTGNYNFADSSDGHDHYNSILPFENNPTCHSCHDADQETLGVLSVKLSLDDLALMQNHSRNATVIASGVMLLILVLSITLFLLVYVDAPIRRLVSAMEHAEQGDLSQARTMVSGSEEMSLLATKFNSMILRLREAMDTTVQHERELAVTQEKLAHAEQLEELNAILEERLKEIQYLNINLEERIEEIEEANYRIADLAGELEEKNVCLTRAVERLQSLHQVGLAINAVTELPALLDLLSHKATETLKGQVGYILMLDEASGCLRIGGAAGLPEDFDRTQAIPFAAGGISFRTVVSNRPVLVEQIGESPEFSRMSQLGYLRESVVCAPIIGRNGAIGSITVANPLDGSHYCAEDLELLVSIAAQASVAIRNVRLHAQAQPA
jgi:methyl-accepting chemotaxis protein